MIAFLFHIVEFGQYNGRFTPCRYLHKDNKTKNGTKLVNNAVLIALKC